jgi:hypothetical protein
MKKLELLEQYERLKEAESPSFRLPRQLIPVALTLCPKQAISFFVDLHSFG